MQSGYHQMFGFNVFAWQAIDLHVHSKREIPVTYFYNAAIFLQIQMNTVSTNFWDSFGIFQLKVTHEWLDNNAYSHKKFENVQTKIKPGWLFVFCLMKGQSTFNWFFEASLGGCLGQNLWLIECGGFSARSNPQISSFEKWLLNLHKHNFQNEGY